MPIILPVTAQALHDAKVPARDVMFAVLPPRKSLPRHTDQHNFLLTSHLAIDVPYSGENKCRLTVGDTEEQWINGEMLLFDSSIYHSAVNDADEMRVVLIVNVWHPELSEVERQALQFIFDVVNGEHDLEVVYDLVYSDEGRRRKAEEELAASRVFPQH
jgi:aspartyl/asparaginyl beta-hydroxylase (cupin superfamily)